MNIRPSAELRQNYSEIAELCRKSAAPVYLTQNGVGDLVLMDINSFHRREKMLELRERLLSLEEDRIAGRIDCSVDEPDSQHRWPEDGGEPRKLSLSEISKLFRHAAESTDRSEFARSWAEFYSFADSLWEQAHWSIEQICAAASITIRELEAITLTPYRTLMRWNAEPDKFSTRERLLILSHMNLLPKF